MVQIKTQVSEKLKNMVKDIDDEIKDYISFNTDIVVKSVIDEEKLYTPYLSKLLNIRLILNNAAISVEVHESKFNEAV